MVRIPARSSAALIPSALEKIKKPLEAIARPIDKMESFLKPAIQLQPVPQDFKQLFEKVQYKKSLEDMTPAQLKEEALRVEEQLIESSTGRAQDPEAKAEALWQRELIQAELKKRELENPDLPIEKYEQLLTGLSDPGLKDEVKRLEAQLKDATTGAHTNEADAAKIKERLDAARSEQAQRVVDDPDVNLLSYMFAVPRLSDKALTAEQAQVRTEYDATLKQLAEHPDQARELRGKLESLASKLTVLDGAMKNRGLEPSSPEQAPVEQPAEVEEPAAEAPVEEPAAPGEPTGSEPYVVVSGDTVSAIAMRISEANGGTPDWETVMADMLELNPLPDPDLILVDQVLQLPVYSR